MSIPMVLNLCEKVYRPALQRRYRILPLLYTLFNLAHTRGTPVATPTFFADPTDLELRTQENSFLLGPLLVYASTEEQSSFRNVKKLPIWDILKEVVDNYDRPDLKKATLVRLSDVSRSLKVAKSGVKKKNRQA